MGIFILLSAFMLIMACVSAYFITIIFLHVLRLTLVLKASEFITLRILEASVVVRLVSVMIFMVILLIKAVLVLFSSIVSIFVFPLAISSHIAFILISLVWWRPWTRSRASGILIQVRSFSFISIMVLHIWISLIHHRMSIFWFYTSHVRLVVAKVLFLMEVLFFKWCSVLDLLRLAWVRRHRHLSLKVTLVTVYIMLHAFAFAIKTVLMAKLYIVISVVLQRLKNSIFVLLGCILLLLMEIVSAMGTIGIVAYWSLLMVVLLSILLITVSFMIVSFTEMFVEAHSGRLLPRKPSILFLYLLRLSLVLKGLVSSHLIVTPVGGFFIQGIHALLLLISTSSKMIISLLFVQVLVLLILLIGRSSVNLLNLSLVIMFVGVICFLAILPLWSLVLALICSDIQTYTNTLNGLFQY